MNAAPLSRSRTGSRRAGEGVPGHIEAVRTHLFESLSAEDMEMLARSMRQVSGQLRAEPPRSSASVRRGSAGELVAEPPPGLSDLELLFALPIR